MRIAVPVMDGKVCQHFGHTPRMVLADVDQNTRQVVRTEEIDSPGHGHGALPAWLHQRSVNVVIAGGIGARAVERLGGFGIEVISGAPEHAPDHVISEYLAARLVSTNAVCTEHGEGHEHHHRHGSDDHRGDCGHDHTH